MAKNIIIKKVQATIDDVDNKKALSKNVWIFLAQRKHGDKIRVEVSILKEHDEDFPEFVGTCVLSDRSYSKLKKEFNLDGTFEEFPSFVGRILSSMQDPRKSFVHCRVFDDQIQLFFGILGEGNLMIDTKRVQTEVVEFLVKKISDATYAVEEVEKPLMMEQQEKSAEKAAKNAPTIPAAEAKSQKIEASKKHVTERLPQKDVGGSTTDEEEEDTKKPDVKPASIKASKHGTSAMATQWEQEDKEQKSAASKIKPEETKEAFAHTGSVVKPSKHAPKVEKHESKTSAKTTKEDASKVSTKPPTKNELYTAAIKAEDASRPPLKSGGWSDDEKDTKPSKAPTAKYTHKPAASQHAQSSRGVDSRARGVDFRYGGTLQSTGRRQAY